MPQIYGLISKAMEEIGAIGKDSYNQQQKFKYRGVDAVMNALNPVMRKCGLFVTPEVLNQQREERQTQSGGRLLYSILTMRYTMYAPDGSSVSATVIGEGMDSGDKASNKAMSVAFKYAMFQLFCIPTEEMIDPDSETPPESKPVPKPEKFAPAYDARGAVKAYCEQSGMSAAEFARMRSALVDGGVVLMRSYDNMTEDETLELIRAVEQNRASK